MKSILNKNNALKSYRSFLFSFDNFIFATKAIIICYLIGISISEDEKSYFLHIAHYYAGCSNTTRISYALLPRKAV